MSNRKKAFLEELGHGARSIVVNLGADRQAPRDALRSYHTGGRKSSVFLPSSRLVSHQAHCVLNHEASSYGASPTLPGGVRVFLFAVRVVELLSFRATRMGLLFLSTRGLDGSGAGGWGLCN